MMSGFFICIWAKLLIQDLYIKAKVLGTLCDVIFTLLWPQRFYSGALLRARRKEGLAAASYPGFAAPFMARPRPPWKPSSCQYTGGMVYKTGRGSVHLEPVLLLHNMEQE